MTKIRTRAAVALSILASSAVLATLPSGPAGATTTSGGPVVLMGIDAEDGGPGGHGPTAVYQSVVDSVLSTASNGGTGILVIGAGKGTACSGTDAFWNAINGSKTYLNGASKIANQPFSGFAMLAVVSDESNTPCGGLTQAEHDALAARQADVAAFVNAGGGLLGFSSDFANPYAYVAGLGSFSIATGLSYDNITPTAGGSAIGISDALDVCCWHDEYLSFPSFLSVLASNAADGNAAAIGGRNVVIPVGITLAPQSATSPAGASHTVTATVKDGNDVPKVGVTVSFGVTAGPNTGQQADPGECAPNTDCSTDSNGRVSWTYTSNGQVGTDTIEACFTNASGTRNCHQASADWTGGPPVCSAVVPSATALWPPNHKFVPVTLTGATDFAGDPIPVTVTGVTQDEPLNGQGDGDTGPDAKAGGSNNEVLLRAERSGTGDGRVYQIAFAATDTNGGTCSGTVTVGVPHDQRPGSVAIDSGQAVNSFGS